jgi:short-subunit dehydrogenase
MQHLTILTGASRGMGLALAEQLCVPDAVLLCISRKTSDPLAARARAQSTELTQWPADLADPVPVAERLRSWLAGLDGAAFASATLINNAGVVDPIGPLDAADPQAMARLLRVDLEAPMQLCAAFLAATGWRRARFSISPRAWAAGPWLAARCIAPPRPAWTTSAVVWRWTRRDRRNRCASYRWRPV